jgi:hypothetical protein
MITRITRFAAAELLAIAAGAHAQPWSTFGDFSAASNPGGPWSYGWISAGAFALFDRAAVLAPDLDIWTAFPDNAPCVGINAAAATQGVPGTSITVPAQAAWGRPGANGEPAAFRFTAPLPGSYRVNGVFREIDTGGTGATELTILMAGATLVDMNIAAGNVLVMDPSPPRQLQPGDTIDFIIGPGASSPSGALEIEGYITALSACYPNCDASTTPPILNVTDFVCFLNHFAAGDAYANCDHSTSPPVLNVLDFVCFLNAFAAGCT